MKMFLRADNYTCNRLHAGIGIPGLVGFSISNFQYSFIRSHYWTNSI